MLGKGVYREAEYWNDEAVKKFWKLKALTFRFPGVTKIHKGSEWQPPETSLRRLQCCQPGRSAITLDAARPAPADTHTHPSRTDTPLHTASPPACLFKTTGALMLGTSWEVICKEVVNDRSRGRTEKEQQFLALLIISFKDTVKWSEHRNEK